jgi:adenylate cyclase
MPLTDLFRIALGLCFPLLLVGHVAATRVSFEWYELAPQYQGVIGGLLSAGAEGKQLALLAPGWAHGCMGLYAAVRRRLWGKLWNASIMAFFVVLPMTAAAGFLVMAAELGAALNDPTTLRPTGVTLTAADGQALGKLRDQILNAYFGLIVFTLLARKIRQRTFRLR